MNWSGVREWVDVVSGAWRPEAERSAAAANLKARTGLDHGDDGEAWATALRPLFIKDVRGALEEMGLFDEERFMPEPAFFAFNSLDLDEELRSCISNDRALGISLSEELWAYGEDYPTFRGAVSRVFGVVPTTEILSGTPTAPKAVRLTLDGSSVELSGDPRLPLLEFLRRWAAERHPDRALYVDESWCARLLSDAERRAVLKYRPFRLRAIDPTDPASVPAEARSALDALREAGLQLDIDPKRLAGDVTAGPLNERMAQLLCMSEAGVALEGDPWYILEELFECVVPSLFRALAKLQRDTLPPLELLDLTYEERPHINLPPIQVPVISVGGTEVTARCCSLEQTEPCRWRGDVQSLFDAINGQLGKSGHPLRLVVVHSNWAQRVIPLPAGTAAALTRSGVLVCGVSSNDAPQTSQGFTPERGVRTTLAELVGPAHLLVGDAECVDSAGDYRPVVMSLCALTQGALRMEFFACSEEDTVRELRLVISGVELRAQLAGDTDYVDVKPLLVCLNDVAERLSERRFYEVRDPAWGQEFGVAFATEGEARTLFDDGFF